MSDYQNSNALQNVQNNACLSQTQGYNSTAQIGYTSPSISYHYIPQCNASEDLDENDFLIQKIENGFVITHLDKEYVAESLDSLCSLLRVILKNENQKK